jgi:hypothetical protein
MNGSRANLAHLYRRGGSNGRADEIDAAVVRAYGPTVEQLLDRSRPDPAAAAIRLPWAGPTRRWRSSEVAVRPPAGLTLVWSGSI